MQFADFDSAAFLQDTWQKRPLLIRNPWAAWANPLEPDELAGLACEEAGIESRLITRRPEGFVLESGPFPEARFAQPESAPWTLLVQAVDHHVPEVAALIAPFRFVPDWRIDDVMVSYATAGGGVGPHFDQYDVFLVQGLGKRRWRVGPRCDAGTELLPHEDLQLLRDFEATGDWVLEPGDILYVPPGFAHDGVAVGDDCMTYSIGFRAPSRADLVEGWTAHLAAAMAEDDRYSDPDLPIQPNPGEITPEALARLRALVVDAVADGAAFARWFGAFNSLPKYADADWRPETPIGLDAVQACLADGREISRNPASRFAFIRQGERAVCLFVDGQSFDCTGDAAALAEQICAGGTLSVEPRLAGSVPVASLLAALVDLGSLAFEEAE
ncbi:JmjC domain-containing protein [Novosphingobium sp.]|uniref:JmjC domain-containing protein n=1 Tax=Novosphingobium sp. TaxID=1874826 RepID=UPI003BA8C691